MCRLDSELYLERPNKDKEMSHLLKAEHLNYMIPFGETILKDISFQISEGQFYGILGKNGAGKTTLIDLILGTRPASRGNLKVLGEDPTAQIRKNREKMSFLSQDITLKGNITILQFLKFHKQLYPRYSDTEEKNICDFFNVDINQKIGALSTGQQKKVQVIAGLSTLPNLLIIDEITAVLDPETRAQFFELLNLFRNKYGTSIILATNIAEDLINRADKILFLVDGNGTEHNPQDINQLFHLKLAA